jgi:hypothetical protein
MSHERDISRETEHYRQPTSSGASTALPTAGKTTMEQQASADEEWYNAVIHGPIGWAIVLSVGGGVIGGIAGGIIAATAGLPGGIGQRVINGVVLGTVCGIIAGSLFGSAVGYLLQQWRRLRRRDLNRREFPRADPTV